MLPLGSRANRRNDSTTRKCSLRIGLRLLAVPGTAPALSGYSLGGFCSFSLPSTHVATLPIASSHRAEWMVTSQNVSAAMPFWP